MANNIFNSQLNKKPNACPYESVDTDSDPEMYQAIIDDARLVPEISETDEEIIINRYKDMHGGYFSIDSLVKSIIKSDDPGFIFKKRKLEHYPYALTVQYSDIADQWFKFFLMFAKPADTQFEYSEHIQLFYDIVSSMNLARMSRSLEMGPWVLIPDPRHLEHVNQTNPPYERPQSIVMDLDNSRDSPKGSPEFTGINQPHEMGRPPYFSKGLPAPIVIDPRYGIPENEPGYILISELFNQFLTEIRKQANSQSFKKRVRDREELSKRNLKSGCDFIDSLFDPHRGHHARLLVLRLDFGYREEISREITIDQAQHDLKHFLNNTRNNKLFESLLGYIWKLEDGGQRGLHYHLIFFLNGSIVQKDDHYGEQFGKYWSECITKGRGTYFNCNRHPLKYRKLGIGMINHYDQDKLMILKKEVLGYLTKKDQYVKVKVKKERTFGRSEMPRESSNRRGRPRIYDSV